MYLSQQGLILYAMKNYKNVIDHSPRSYPEHVTLTRRRESKGANAGTSASIDAIFDWLLDDAIRERDLLVLFDTFCWRLAATDLPLDRMSLHVGTLHPQIQGFGWGWRRSDGLTDEIQVDQSVMTTDIFRSSPLQPVIEEGGVFVADTNDPELCRRFPLLGELAAEGIRHYIAAPLSANGNFHNAITVATRDPGGFTPAHIAAFKRVGRPLALLVDRFIGSRIARNVMDVYLGSVAGKKVLTGSIGRGDGQAMKAIIWASDMRGFTHYADNLSAPDVLALLNAYFECVAGAVTAHGGEVLKFIGDGLLAVFPLEEGNDDSIVAQSSLAAALHARGALAALNAAPPTELAAAFALGPIKSGIALHEGEVFFGNMGSPDRLDFTVIGRAVNATSRIEALTKTLGRDILITESVAARIKTNLDDLGAHALRGLDEPLRLFSPGPADGP